jgi:hypothetical protein
MSGGGGGADSGFFSAAWRGHKFPDSIYNNGPLPPKDTAGYPNGLGAQADARINYNSTLLGDLQPYAYGKPGRLSSQTAYLPVPHMVQKIVPVLTLPAARRVEETTQLYHAVSDGDLAFAVILDRLQHANLAYEASETQIFGMGGAYHGILDPLVNLCTVNYLLAGIQLFTGVLDDDTPRINQYPQWKMFLREIGFFRSEDDLKIDLQTDLERLLQIVANVFVPFGIPRGSEMQGGQTQGTGRPDQFPVDHVTALLLDGKCQNLVNIWRKQAVSAGDDMILRLTKATPKRYTLTRYTEHANTQTFDDAIFGVDARIQRRVWQLHADVKSWKSDRQVPPAGVAPGGAHQMPLTGNGLLYPTPEDGYDHRTDGYWHICMALQSSGRDPTHELDDFADAVKYRRTGELMEVSFEPTWVNGTGHDYRREVVRQMRQSAAAAARFARKPGNQSGNPNVADTDDEEWRRQMGRSWQQRVHRMIEEEKDPTRKHFGMPENDYEMWYLSWWHWKKLLRWYDWDSRRKQYVEFCDEFIEAAERTLARMAAPDPTLKRNLAMAGKIRTFFATFRVRDVNPMQDEAWKYDYLAKMLGIAAMGQSQLYATQQDREREQFLAARADKLLKDDWIVRRYWTWRIYFIVCHWTHQHELEHQHELLASQYAYEDCAVSSLRSLTGENFEGFADNLALQTELLARLRLVEASIQRQGARTHIHYDVPLVPPDVQRFPEHELRLDGAMPFGILAALCGIYSEEVWCDINGSAGYAPDGPRNPADVLWPMLYGPYADGTIEQELRFEGFTCTYKGALFLVQHAPGPDRVDAGGNRRLGAGMARHGGLKTSVDIILKKITHSRAKSFSSSQPNVSSGASTSVGTTAVTSVGTTAVSAEGQGQRFLAAPVQIPLAAAEDTATLQSKKIRKKKLGQDKSEVSSAAAPGFAVEASLLQPSGHPTGTSTTTGGEGISGLMQSFRASLLKPPGGDTTSLP